MPAEPVNPCSDHAHAFEGADNAVVAFDEFVSDQVVMVQVQWCQAASREVTVQEVRAS